jgi:hypothetical protein
MMSTINGVPARPLHDQATAADRRRPGRAAVDNPHLIEMMRNSGAAVPEALDELLPPAAEFRRGVLLGATAFSLAVWAAAAAVIFWL